jgi:UDP-N-acetylglucosamine 2-epimerase (non-hydrolysing)
MPEEINRVLTDALSDVLFITEESAAKNLLKEGIPKERIHLVGNTMVDTLLKHRDRAKNSDILRRLGFNVDSGSSRTSPFGILTLHRPSNVDNQEVFEGILEAVSVIAKEMPVLFPIHPRTLNRIREFRLERYFNSLAYTPQPLTTRSGIYGLEPLGYLDFLCLMSNARLVLTDSGGIQEETTVLGVPCVTLRENTERPITIARGTNVLAGTDREAIIRHALRQLDHPTGRRKPRFWDGRAGERIIAVLVKRHSGIK